MHPRCAARRGGLRLRPVFLAARALASTAAELDPDGEESAEPPRHGAARCAIAARHAIERAHELRAATCRSPLYVHMPWCVRKCPYCDFNSHQLKSAAPPRELHRCADPRLRRGTAARSRGRAIETVFFGGGTPSLFRARGVRAAARGVQAADRVRRRCRDHAGGQSRDRRARPLRRLSRRRHQPRVARARRASRRARSSGWAASMRPRTRIARSRSCAPPGSAISIWI